MPATINHNAHLHQIHRSLSLHHASAERDMEQLASGRRVNRSSDDPASLSLADSIRAESRALAEGGRNVQQTIQLLQVAEGALSTISDMLNRMHELSTQAASATYQDVDRSGINAEFQQLKDEVDRMADFTTYNGLHLLREDHTFTVQSGPSETNSDVAQIRIGNVRTNSPAMDIADITILTSTSARQSMDKVQSAQDVVLAERNRIAAFQRRLEMHATTTASIMERMRGAESDVRDADLADAISNVTRSQILSQTAAAFAMEADTDIDRILSLLQ